MTRTEKTGSDQYATKSGPSDLYTLALTEQLTQMGMTDLRVSGSSQTQYLGPGCLGSSIGRSTTAVAMTECNRSFYSVSRKQSPRVAYAHTHQSGRLLYRHLFCQEAIEDLKSCLFSLAQCQCLHYGDIFASLLERTESLAVYIP